MSFETEWENELTLQLLELKPDDPVMEVGFGHGKTIQKAAVAVPQGLVAGVDVSPLMVKIAGEHNRNFVRNGRVKLALGDGAHIPYPDSSFYKCFSVHTVYFWPRPIEVLEEIHRILRPQGRFVLSFRYDDKALRTFPLSVYRFYPPDEVLSLLNAAGFYSGRIESRANSSRALFWAIGEK